MVRRYLPAIFYLLCAVEGTWAFLSLLFTSQSQPPNLLHDTSALRWLLLGFIAAFVVAFGYFAVRSLFLRGNDQILTDISHPRRVVIGFMLFLVVLAAAWLLACSPLRLERLHSYALRWQPLWVWLLLICCQFFLLAALSQPYQLWLQTTGELYNPGQLSGLLRRLNTPLVGLLLIGSGILLGVAKHQFGQFVDEANNLVYGWLITEGRLPFRDVFSQHFPFAYYWMGMVVALFGNSQSAARISILILQFILFTFSMKTTRLYLPVGLTALVWGMTSHLYRGTMVLYDAFDGIFMLVIFILFFSFMVERSAPKISTLLVAGVLMGCAFLSNPLMLYPILVAFGALFISGFSSTGRSGWQEGLRRVIWSGSAAALVLGLFVFHLIISNSFQDFYRFVIWFNANIYDQYNEASPNRLGQIFYQLATGLNVFSPQWRQHISPFLPVDVYRFRLADEGMLYSWIFTSLLFRLSILFCTLGLFLRRKFLAAGFLYFYAATFLARSETGWHTIPFILLSQFAAIYFLLNFASPESQIRILPGLPGKIKDGAHWIWQQGWRLVTLLILTMFFWSALRGAYFLYQHRSELNNRAYLNRLERFETEIRRITCDQPGVELLIYPFDPMIYFASKILPASRYSFMHPWVAEIAIPELIGELKEHPSAVVQIKTERVVWQEYKVGDYLSELIVFLDQNYHPLSNTLWMSPQLAENCTASPPQLPDDSGAEP